VAKRAGLSAEEPSRVVVADTERHNLVVVIVRVEVAESGVKPSEGFLTRALKRRFCHTMIETTELKHQDITGYRLDL